MWKVYSITASVVQKSDVGQPTHLLEPEDQAGSERQKRGSFCEATVRSFATQHNQKKKEGTKPKKFEWKHTFKKDDLD